MPSVDEHEKFAAITPSLFAGIYLYCRGLAGYFQDLYRIARLDFSNPHSYMKYLLINRLRKTTGANVLIEAGTFRGVTTARCSFVFNRVYSIELDEALAAAATRNLSRRPNVKVIQGDALKVLPELLEDPNIDDALLFLDGHFSGGETACGDMPEPAAEELKSLEPYKAKIRAIVIDDLRSFGTEKGFPRKSELLRSAEDSFGPDFDISVFLDQLILTRRINQLS